MWNDFKAFVMRGNVMDLAVGVIIGAAFGAVIMSPMGLATGGMDFSEKYMLLKEGAKAAPPYPTLAAARDAGAVTLNYGAFVNTIITFLIVALAIFLLVRAVNRLYRQPAAATPNTKPCPYCTLSVSLEASRCPHCTSQIAGAAVA